MTSPGHSVISMEEFQCNIRIDAPPGSSRDLCSKVTHRRGNSKSNFWIGGRLGGFLITIVYEEAAYHGWRRWRSAHMISECSWSHSFPVGRILSQQGTTPPYLPRTLQDATADLSRHGSQDDSGVSFSHPIHHPSSQASPLYDDPHTHNDSSVHSLPNTRFVYGSRF